MKSLTYKKKCYLMFALLLAFFIVAYKFSFSQTLDNRKESSEKEKKIAFFKTREKEIPVLKKKLAHIEQLVKNSHAAPVRDRLTAFISAYAENNDCTVMEIPHAEFYKSAGNFIETNTFAIRGRFKTLLSLEHLLEKTFKSTARIMSVRYQALSNHRKKTKELYLTIITQSFIKSENNETI